jgi:4-diphosphocytidyl-2-C-methyl-D-erythritol kinase
VSKPGRLLALAKLTLSLRVVGVRSDGYHLLDAEMVNVDLADMLEIGPGEGFELLDETGGAPVPADGTNLVAKALVLLGCRARVRLFKRVPAGAGLGGGSADAAAVLRWAVASGSVSGAQALELAAKLGSDVPFCLAGGGRAHVGGAGEVLVALPFEEVAGRAYTLLVPPFGVSTAAVYKAWDHLHACSRPAANAVPAVQGARSTAGARPGPDDAGARPGPNDLEAAALAVEPRLAEWRDKLAAATGRQPVLAGSGSTWFVEGDFPGDGRLVVRTTRP